jgi:hypothetical protein
MHRHIRGSRLIYALLTGVLVALTLTACGGSGGDAANLLKQTFGQQHTVNSGNLNLSLVVSPAGSKTSNAPLNVSFGGPFQSHGKGKLPASNFNISISALGRTGSLGVLSTGANGYVTFAGTSYQLPVATFQRLESNFAQVTSSPTGGGKSGSLAKLGIDPLHWLVKPSVVGKETLGDAPTTHIRAGLNVAALLTDLNMFLQKANAAGVTGSGKLPSQLSDSTRGKISAAVKNPSVDVWTGSSDKMLRKLAINLTVPVSGQVSTLLGGIRSAQIGITLGYTQLNRPQAIVAPTNVRPFGEFTTKLRTFLAAQGAGATASNSGSGASGGSSASATASNSGSGASGGSSGGAASSGNQTYIQCIQAAGQDVDKLQQCASLLQK